jgi:hypothetical protein
MMFSRVLGRAVEMLEEKVLRVGENHLQLWFLTSGYGMFLSMHEPERTDFHLQTCIDRATFLVCKALGREEQVRHLKVVSELVIPQNVGNHIQNEVRTSSRVDQS